MGVGDKVHIGLDVIKGLTSGHNLPTQIICFLNKQRIFTLAHIGGTSKSFSLNLWPYSIELEMSMGFEAHRETYHVIFVNVDISLSNKPHKFSWSRSAKEIKEAYSFISSHIRSVPYVAWLSHMWNWDVPSKIKCFTWLAIHN